MVRSFSTSPGPRVLTDSLRYARCFMIAFRSKNICFYILISFSTHIHSSLFSRFSHHCMNPTFWDASTPPPPPPKKATRILWFLLNMEWNASMNSVIISSLEMPFALLFFPQINYVITEKSLWSSPKNSLLLPDPGTIIMPCVIKTERGSPANCECAFTSQRDSKMYSGRLQPK